MANDPADEALMLAFGRGDEAAFEALFHRYRDRVTCYAWRMLGRAEEAEEVALEAFTRVASDAWRPTGTFRSFLFTMVHRLCLDRLKRRSRAFRAERTLLAAQTPAPSPERGVAAREEHGRLEQALGELPEAHRSVLLLYYEEELTSAELAQVLGCTDQQVRSRLSYARRLLRQQLDAEEVVS